MKIHERFRYRGRPLLMGAVRLVCVLLCAARIGSAQDSVKIWEFAPYEVEVWCAIDPGLGVSEFAKSQFSKSLADDLERCFQAAWNTQVKVVDGSIRSQLNRDIETLKLDDLTRQELVLVVNRDAAQASIRTLDAAIDKISEYAILAEHKSIFDRGVATLTLDSASPVARIVSKLKVTEGDFAALIAGLEAKSIAAALVPRTSLKAIEKVARQIPMILPWQSDNLLRQRDKVFFVSIEGSNGGFQVKVRELDCAAQYFGPSLKGECSSWSYLSRVTTSAIATAFAPIARVENAQSKSAELRAKAGGLITSPDNPARIQLGDLMHPIVRREDRNGVPTLIESIPWTYAAITETDGIKMNANVYAYSGGPGLAGRNNRSTKRILLRVRPLYAETEIMVTVRGTGRPQGGCAVYQRDLTNEKFELLGKTDWRGRFKIPPMVENVSILPETLRAAKAAYDKAAKESAEHASASSDKAKESTEESSSSAASGDNSQLTAVAPPAPALAPVDIAGKEIQLRQPLVQLYVKSGDVVLARLPVVPGFSTLEVAELSDDTRRLEAEALMRGFQGEILDLIGLRTLLSTRVNKLLKQNKGTEAEKVMAELRRLKDYAAMVETLDRLQRKALDESTGPISLGTKSRIDKLFQTTREMMQKYLQNDLVRNAEAAVSKGPNTIDAATAPSPQSSSTDTQCSFAGFSFNLPSRFKIFDTPRPPNMPAEMDVKSWVAEASPEANFLAHSVKDAKGATEAMANSQKFMTNFLAGLTDKLGIKIENRSEPKTSNLGGIDFTYFDFNGNLNGQPVFGFIYSNVKDDRILSFVHVGFAGDATTVNNELRKHLATLKAN